MTSNHPKLRDDIDSIGKSREDTPADRCPRQIQADAFLAAIVESADDAIISKDLGGVIISWNQGAERIFGYKADEIIGKPVLTILPPERSEEEPAILARIRRGERVEPFETVRVRKDGSRVDVSLTISPIKDAGGRVVGASKIARDITELKRAEQLGQELSNSIRQQRSVSQLGLAALREPDLQHLFDRAVAEVAKILDVEMCKVLERLPGGREVLLRSGVGWMEGLVGQATVSTGLDSQAGYTLISSKPVIVEDLRTEARFSGPPLLNEHGVISGISCIIMGENDRPWGILGAHAKSRRRFTDEDVAFLQAVANVLAGSIQRKAAEQQFRLAVEAAPNGMVIVDQAGLILMVNTQMEQLFGYSRTEMLGQPIEILLPQRYRGGHPDQRQAFFASPEARAMGHGRDLFARRKDGTEFPVEVGLNPAKMPEGPCVLAAVIDITRRKRMESELAQAHADLHNHARSLEAMVAERTANLQETIAELKGVSYSLSHDMRAPLRTIRSFSEIVLSEAEEQLGDRQKQLLQKVIRSAGRLDRLIQDVLIYSRIARESIALAPMDVEGLLRQIIDERQEFQPPKAQVDIERPLLRVRGHEAYLTQCITNLLDNAVKFVAPGTQPRVRIRSELCGDQVRLWFEDNGIGIPREAQERMFGIFQRMHDDSIYPGTGIGLGIVRKAVERMGGTAGVESSPGQGSRFWVQLPSAP